jgi:hypothetical protein
MSQMDRPAEACCLVCGQEESLFVTTQGQFLCWGHLEQPLRKGELGELRAEIERMEEQNTRLAGIIHREAARLLAAETANAHLQAVIAFQSDALERLQGGDKP